METSYRNLKIVVFVLLNFVFSNVFGQCSITSNLVTNGNFSSGNTGFSSSYGYNPGNLTPEGKYDVLTNPRNDHPNFATCGDHTSGSGNMMVVNGANTAGVTVWCGSVSVNPNSSYTFSTWVASVHPTSPAILQFSINGVNLGSPFTASSTTCTWQQFCETWSSGANTTASICIVNQNTAASGNDFALDDIQMGVTATLHVKISNFSVKNFYNAIYLNWSTIEEINNDYFVIEKSIDLTHWEEIGKVNSTSNVNYLTSYEFLDHARNNNSLVYYRIKSVDKFGNVELSNVKSLDNNENNVIVCPNPSYDRISILSDQRVYAIYICNSFEIEVKKFLFDNEEVRPTDLDVSELKPGIYYLKILSQNFENAQVVNMLRFIKK
ncbi:MAG: hypothetical protein RLZZ175_2085 [Bacteroidota bacterium]|jgi:hypothetical protein